MYITQDLIGGDLDVHCDGYFLRFRLANTNVCSAYVDGAAVADFGDQYIAGVTSRVSQDDNLIRTVLEDTPTRVKIRAYGQVRSNAQALMTNNLWAEQIFTIYPDRFTYDYKMEMSGDNELSSNVVHGTMYIWHPAAEAYVLSYEDNGSETVETGINDRDSAKYLLTANAEASFQSVTLSQSYPSGGGLFHQVADDITGGTNQEHRRNVAMNPTGPELVQGIYSVKVMVIIDTIYREGSAKKYDILAQRISFGNQYKDPMLDASPPSGARVTDMISPAPVSGTDGTLHADASHIYEPNSVPATKVSLDIKRCNTAIVNRNWPYHTGSVTNPVDHLLNYLTLNDNTSNNTLLSEVGPSGSWHNVSDGTARNTSGDSVQVIGRGRNLDTQDGVAFLKLAVGAGTVHDADFLKKGSILVKLKPEFLYDTADDQQIFYLYQGLDDRIRAIYDAGNDRFEFDVTWGGTHMSIFAPAITSNFEFQRETIILFYWDADRDLYGFAVDGKVIANGINTGTPTSSDPSVFVFNIYYDLSTNPGDYIFDEIKTFDVAILPYGAHFMGNGYGLLKNINDPHADLSWYFDGQAALAKGGTSLATTRNPTNSGGQFVTTDPIVGSWHWDSNGTGALTIADISEDIIDYDSGFVGIWFNLQTPVSGGEYLFDVRDADGSDRISAVFDASGNLDVTYRSNSVDVTVLGDIPISDGHWYYFKIAFHTSDQFHNAVHSYINGMESVVFSEIADVWTGGDGLTWHFTEDYNNANGCDAFIGKITMGKQAHTPEIWTVYGEPIHIPTIDKV